MAQTVRRNYQKTAQVEHFAVELGQEKVGAEDLSARSIWRTT